MRLPLALVFTALTFLAWGTYGPTLHRGSEALHHDSLRAFVGVGLAYFLIAVLIPLVLLRKQREAGLWTVGGVLFSVLAGAVGAIGALGVIWALVSGGSPVFVMPLVFGFAPIVNTLVTATLSQTFNQIRPVFVFGVLAAAVGAAGVLYFKPGPASDSDKSTNEMTEEAKPVVYRTAMPALQDGQDPSKEQPAASTTDSESSTGATADDSSSTEQTTIEPADEAPDQDENPPADHAAQTDEAGDETPSSPDHDSRSVEGTPEEQTNSGSDNSGAEAMDSDAVESPARPESLDQPDEEVTEEKENDMSMVILSVALAALCWGSYGPLLHIGQAKMKGSRLRPFMCVGIAYFVIAVAAPLAIIAKDGGVSAMWHGWTLAGLAWSFAAGAAGAVGALGIVLAFNVGGKPYYVMPLVFGFAPVVNTFISLTQADAWDRVPTMFWICLVTVIAGAVTVLLTAPRPRPKPAQ